MYSEIFSRIYNEFGWNYYPEAFAEQLTAWIRKNMPHAKRVLDLGCGTGVLCRILRAQGFEADGADLSENMIAIARAADPEGHYETADMTEYSPRKKYDLVTCTGDAMNHLTDLRDVDKTFGRVLGYLEKGGYFIFDLLNETEITEPEPIEFSYDEQTDAAFLMTKDDEGLVTLRVTVREGGRTVLEELIHERIYDAEVICGLLKRTGFREVSCSHRLLEDGADVQTWYVIAKA